MTKPDFSKMTRRELKKYVLNNREDDEALEFLIRTAKPDGPAYPCPKTEEEMAKMQLIFNEKIKQLEARSAEENAVERDSQSVEESKEDAA